MGLLLNKTVYRVTSYYGSALVFCPWHFSHRQLPPLSSTGEGWSCLQKTGSTPTSPENCTHHNHSMSCSMAAISYVQYCYYSTKYFDIGVACDCAWELRCFCKTRQSMSMPCRRYIHVTSVNAPSILNWSITSVGDGNGKLLGIRCVSVGCQCRRWYLVLYWIQLENRVCWAFCQPTARVPMWIHQLKRFLLNPITCSSL